MKRISLGLLIVGVSLIILVANVTISSAHISPEQPWHPVAAAYLRATFYLNLGPQIDWARIEEEFTADISEEGYSFNTVYEALEPVEAAFDSSLVAPIQTAIAEQDAHALFEHATRALSQAIRYYIAQAEDKISDPGAAQYDVNAAQQLYRAFEQDFISQADPDGHRELGQAWLNMSNSVGNAGLGGVGGQDSNPEQFAGAKAVIEDYLIANYENGVYTEQTPLGTTRFAPLPAGATQASIPIWTPPGTNLNDQQPLPLLRLNLEARGFEESDVPLVAFGDMLFDSPQIFGDPARSLGVACSTCHNRSDINRTFFIPGVSHQAGAADVDGAFFNPYFNDQRSDSLDIPSLRGLRFTAPYGRDGRFESLREFTRNVIVNEFAGEEPTEFMLDALVAYLLEFDFLPNANLNPDGTLTDQASEAARRGEVIFKTPYEGMLDGKSCASCHIPGSHFTDGRQWDIGTAEASDPYAYENYFDTPTLLNSNYTFPYFHDGSLDTLEDVARWKNDRFNMNLDEQEIADLTEYLNTVGAADTPYETFDEENTRFMLDWSELTTFASTLGSMLIPQQDAEHAVLLIDTVAADMRLDATGLQDYDDAQMVYEAADKLEEIKTAIQQEDWATAETLFEEYQDLVDTYTPMLR